MIARIHHLVRGLLAILAMMLLFTGLTAQAQTPTNDAQVISMVVPPFVAGGSGVVTVTMQNTGTTIWPAFGNYKLRTLPPWALSEDAVIELGVDREVAPGQQYIFSIPLTAEGDGYYFLDAQMELAGSGVFGGIANGAVVVDPAVPVGQNAAQVISIIAPATLTPGQNATVSVTMQNTGTTTWSANGNYALCAQNPANNATWGPTCLTFNGNTVPGQQLAFVIPVSAPAAAGAYSMQWQMAKIAGSPVARSRSSSSIIISQGLEWFGDIATAPVTVTGAAPPVTPGTETVTYIHTDGLGSPVARTDSSGTLISRTSYEPYGRTAGGVTPTIGFTGHVNDADTGLVYMQQRYYDPVAGRFLSVDPVVTDAHKGSSFNRYSYGNNNPYKYIDLDGRNAIINHKKDGSLLIQIPITFTGRGGAIIARSIEQQWSGNYVINGKSTDVKVEVTSGSLNNISLVKENTLHGVSYVQGGNSGEWRTANADNKEREHEAGHLMGAGDKYDRKDAGTAQEHTEAKPGYESNIMGKVGGKVEGKNFEEILASPQNTHEHEK